MNSFYGKLHNDLSKRSVQVISFLSMELSVRS